MKLADLEALAPMTGRSYATLRRWAIRYPNLLPQRGENDQHRALYAVSDAYDLVSLCETRTARHVDNQRAALSH